VQGKKEEERVAFAMIFIDDKCSIFVNENVSVDSLYI
jgi:hypothetical protein